MVTSLFLATIILFAPVNLSNKILTDNQIGSGVSIVMAPIEEIPTLKSEVQAFLESKDSPLAPHTDLLLKQEHWKLLVAISAIESQYCTRQLGNNCWGIGGDSAYKHYDSVEEAIIDANALITRWQSRGRWLTVEDMNCHYVVPCNENWVNVVNKVLNQMENYERDRRLSQQETGDSR